jgi:hypothetical protein
MEMELDDEIHGSPQSLFMVEPKNWSALMVPDASMISLFCEYFSNQEDEYWAAPSRRSLIWR